MKLRAVTSSNLLLATKRSERSNLFNCAVVDKASLIVATLQKEHWFAFIKQGTVDSKIFGLFLGFIQNIVVYIERETGMTTKHLLDNAHIKTYN